MKYSLTFALGLALLVGGLTGCNSGASLASADPNPPSVPPEPPGTSKEMLGKKPARAQSFRPPG